MRKLGIAFMATLAGGAFMLSASAAGAQTGATAAAGRPSPHASPTVLGMSSTLPAGYTVVSSAPFAAPNGIQSHGSVSCPGLKQPAGGGAWTESGSVFANINSSYPSGHSWEVDVNNTSGSDTSFTVYAVCLAASSSYTVATTTSTTGQGERDAAIDCPATTKVVGGGVLSSTLSTGVNVDSSTPFALDSGASGWEVFMSSTDSTPSSYTVFAVCHSKPRGWSVQTGRSVAVTSGTQAEATVSCPGASVPLGGGAFTGFDTLAQTVDLNTAYPAGNGWHVYENNDQPSSYWVAASTVCAGI
jgi:hypothetical protein